MLLGAVSMPLLASGCTSNSGGSDGSTPGADRVALQSALDVEKRLYLVVGNLSGTGRDGLQAFDAVDAHVRALDTALGQPPSFSTEFAPPPSSPGLSASRSATASPSLSPSSSSSPSSPGTSPRVTSIDQAIRAADRAVNAHLRTLRSASAAITPLIASIAASDESIAAQLRGGDT
jgi:hypothetical protein